MAASAALQPPVEGHAASIKKTFADIVSKHPRHAVSGTAKISLPPQIPSIVREPATYKGKPAVFFTKEDVQTLSSPFRFSLVGKFSKGRPRMEALCKEFQAIGFHGPYSIGQIGYRHILIRFEHEEDYLRCWMKGVWSFQGFIMRTFKWSPSFSVESESPLAPVWVSLPRLHIHLFSKEPLFSIARLIREPLKVDVSTITLNRPSVARFCVEVDLRQELPDKLWIGQGAAGFWQQVDYDNLPAYCSECHKLGHQVTSCRNSRGLVDNRSTHVPKLPLRQPPKAKEDKIWIVKGNEPLNDSGLHSPTSTLSAECAQQENLDPKIVMDLASILPTAQQSGEAHPSSSGLTTQQKLQDSCAQMAANGLADAVVLPAASLSGDAHGRKNPADLVDDLPDRPLMVLQSSDSLPSSSALTALQKLQVGSAQLFPDWGAPAEGAFPREHEDVASLGSAKQPLFFFLDDFQIGLAKRTTRKPKLDKHALGFDWVSNHDEPAPPVNTLSDLRTFKSQMDSRIPSLPKQAALLQRNQTRRTRKRRYLQQPRTVLTRQAVKASQTSPSPVV